ncbi:hypothetical protein FM036_27175 [Nostoc sp. HG1]|nr:hypothetical protein [Nostoc sp. HG1]
MRFQLLALTIPFILASCTPQLSTEEKLDECIKLAKFANKSIETTVFGGDSKSANQAADNLELNARFLREAKFRDAGIKNTAEQLALLNEKSAKTARQLGKTVDKLDQKIGDPDLIVELKEKSSELTKIGDEVTALANPQLKQCSNQNKNI